MSFKKIKTILLSRFRKEKEEDWVWKRREACIHCPYNSLNKEKLTLKQEVAKFFSDLYTKITFSDYIDLGECECTCSVFYKTREPLEECYAKEEYGDDRWQSIFIPQNSKKKAR